MHALSFPCIVMASIDFCVGAFYLYFFLKSPKQREHLPFALLCFSIGFYNVFCVGLYNSSSVGEGVFWQRLQFHMVALAAVFLAWFTGIFTEQKVNRIIRVLIAWFIVVFFVSLVAGPELTLSPARPEIKNVVLFGSATITCYEGALGAVYLVEIVSLFIAYLYLLYLYVRFYRKTGDRAVLLVIFCQIIYFVGVTSDSLVAMRVYPFVYVSEYSYSFIIVSMAYVLLGRFVGMHAAFEELNVSLEEKVAERTSRIEKLNEELRQRAEYDSLTGIYNRRFFGEYFEIEVKRAKSFIEHRGQLDPGRGNDMNFGLAILDVDQFKSINDAYGHPAGDSVLRQLTGIMKENLFKRDVVCRYGGDEFVMLLTKTSPEGIFQAAEKIRKEIDEHAFTFGEDGKKQHVTISMGLVDFNEVLDKSSEEILKLADDRLLAAKNRGKNRVVSGTTTAGYLYR